MKWLYGVFWRDTNTQALMWGMSTSRIRAIRASKQHAGSDVYRVGYDYADVWDAPTFKTVGIHIFTHRTNVLSSIEAD